MAIAIILPLALCLALVGCGDVRTKWIGSWEGQLVPVASGEEQDPIAYTVNRVLLEFRPDGTFELIRGGMPNEGKVSFSKNKATLRLETVMGRPLEREPANVKEQNPDVEVVWVGDGNIRLTDPKDFGREPVLLVRRND